MSRVISICNRKGGTGKTTTAINLGAYLASFGKFVLLIDIDPQANTTSGLGIDHLNLDKSIYEVLLGTAAFREIIKETAYPGLRLAPAAFSLAGAEVELIDFKDREYRLSQALLEVQGLYDYIIIDCPPSLGLLTVNGLAASSEVLIPVQAEYYALEGLGQLLSMINLVKENLKPELQILGAVLTMYDSRFKLSDEVLEELYRYFPNKIFRSVIPRDIKLAEAPSFGKAILDYDSVSKAARAYRSLAQEILNTY